MCQMATISMFWNFDYCTGTPEIDKKTVRFDQARPAVHSRDGYWRLGPSARGPFDLGSQFIRAIRRANEMPLLFMPCEMVVLPCVIKSSGRKQQRDEGNAFDLGEKLPALPKVSVPEQFLGGGKL